MTKNNRVVLAGIVFICSVLVTMVPLTKLWLLPLWWGAELHAWLKLALLIALPGALFFSAWVAYFVAVKLPGKLKSRQGKDA